MLVALPRRAETEEPPVVLGNDRHACIEDVLLLVDEHLERRRWGLEAVRREHTADRRGEQPVQRR